MPIGLRTTGTITAPAEGRADRRRRRPAGGRAGRAGRVLAALGAGGLVAAGPGPAASASPAPRRAATVDFALTGPLTISWSGAPSRCAAAGVCGVTGSMELNATDAELPTSGPAGAPAGQQLELTDAPAIRVTMPAPNGAIVTCTDVLWVDVSFRLEPGPAGPRAVIAPDISGDVPSSGHCAGPTARDLLSLALPVTTTSHGGYRMTTTVSLTAGPFDVTVTPGLTVLESTDDSADASPRAPAAVRRSRAVRAAPGVRIARVRRLTETARFIYRVTAASGGVPTTFHGAAAPLCEPLGACGARGTLTQTLSPGGEIVLAGSAAITRRRTAAQILADARDEQLPLTLTMVGRLGETTTEHVEGPDGLACSDAVLTPAVLAGTPALGVGLAPEEPGSSHSAPIEPGSLSDVWAMRTRCPGPTVNDLSLDALEAYGLTGVFPLSGLGARLLQLGLAGIASFASPAYDGHEHGTVTLTLRRVGEQLADRTSVAETQR